MVCLRMNQLLKRDDREENTEKCFEEFYQSVAANALSARKRFGLTMKLM